ncbi:MAG: glycosyltransferase [Kiritimatiellae bacterium]|jgi:processive 1,2-diacylglycerol beta-glucosyltransferase|nr:glycosyltransferase [Kiritimatiellia bacterium]
MQEKLKVMILYANAGNGHRRAAEALHDVCISDDRFSEVALVDVLDYTNKVFQDLYSNLYIETIKTAPAIWSLVFDSTDQPWKKEKVRLLVERLNSQPLLKKIKQFDADICISTHFMPASILSYLIAKKKISCHHSVVVTDYYVHASWLTAVMSRYFVAKEESKIQLKNIGCPIERISTTGIPIDSKFAQSYNIPELQDKYGVSKEVPLVLLSAGAFGVMSGNDLIQMLKLITEPCEIAIICGKNEKLQKQISNEIKKLKSNTTQYHVVGFTKEMHEWMAMSSLYIGKPGGLTTSECLAMGLPMVIWEPIPGQEVFNTSYLLENGAAIAPDSALTLGYRINDLLQNPKKLEKLAASAKQLGKPNAGKNIINIIQENIKEDNVLIKRKENILIRLLFLSNAKLRRKVMRNLLSE